MENKVKNHAFKLSCHKKIFFQLSTTLSFL